MSDLELLSLEELFDVGEDPSLDGHKASTDLFTRGKQGVRIAVVRTSDRTSFKRCRRRWNWQSHLRQNLAPREHVSPLWTGTGFHFALEDFHGWGVFPHPRDAFKAYVKATHAQAKNSSTILPWDWPEQTKLAIGMLEYYVDYWLTNRPKYNTFIYRGRPQVEVHSLVPIPVQTPFYGYDEVWYASTFDRVAEIDGELWILEYKTAKRIQTLHYQTDPQVGAYVWIGNHLYGRPIAGVIYQQHRKNVPDEPRLLGNGTISTDIRQATSHSHYRHALKKLYGDPRNAPAVNLDILNQLALEEDDSKDRYVRRDRISRNQRQCETEGVKIMMEIEDLLNPDLPLYPNPTRDCAHMCPFSSPCISMDDGSDWESELAALMEPKDRDFDSWRVFLPDNIRSQMQ
jgi:hypothetical protein